MKVLFLNPEQYVGWEDEPSNHELRLPILHCGAVTEHRDVCYQRMFRESGHESTHRHILSLVDSFHPQIVINSTTWPNQSVSSDLLHAIMRRGVPVYTQVWDTFMEPAPHELEWFYSCTYLGIASSVSSFLAYQRRAESGCGPRGVIFTTGHNVFTDRVRKLPLPKRYDVLLLGSNEGQRTILKKFLASRLPSAGVSFCKLGGLIDWEKCQGPSDRERLTDSWLPWDKYIEAINCAKVCVCSQTGKGRLQIKGKLFEFLACGTFVLTDASEETQRFIPEGCVAYYKDVPECLEKAVYYVRNDTERERVARAGHEWFHSQFDYRRFWSTVLRAAASGDVAILRAAFESNHYSASLVEAGGSGPPSSVHLSRVRSLLCQGYSHFGSGHFQEAARKFGAACKLNPPPVEAYAALAHLARYCKDTETLSVALDRIRQIDPTHPEAMLELATLRSPSIQDNGAVPIMG